MEKTSALMDGELDARQTEAELARLKQDPEARAAWEMYHVIGDALRGDRAVSGNIARRVSERLAQEPTVLAPRPKRPAPVTRYAFSIAASLAAVAFVGWMAWQLPRPDETVAEPQPLPAAAEPASQLASVPSDGRENGLLLAHQEYSPSTSIQGLAPYVRTISGHAGQGSAVRLPAAPDSETAGAAQR
jgi:sigma-E factor negative regulatory protein RseA